MDDSRTGVIKREQSECFSFYREGDGFGKLILGSQDVVDGFKTDGSQGDDNFRLDDLKNRFQVGRTISNFTSGGAAVIAVLQRIA